MSLTISSNSFNAFSLSYVFNSALRTAFNKFFICIVDAPFFIFKVEEQKGII